MDNRVVDLRRAAYCDSYRTASVAETRSNEGVRWAAMTPRIVHL